MPLQEAEFVDSVIGGTGSRLAPSPRETRDPYAILVSEVMLQQTQASRVVERYNERWLARWPTAAALAAASPAEVMSPGAGWATTAARCACTPLPAGSPATAGRRPTRGC